VKQDKEKHYLDACIFAAFLNQTSEVDNYQECLPVIQAAERQEIMAFTSTVSLSEVIYIKESPEIREDVQEEIISKLFNSPWLNLISFEPVVAQVTRQIARKYKRKPLDTVHLASALRVGAKFFHTIDQKLINSLPYGVDLSPDFSQTLIVQRPSGFQTAIDFTQPDLRI
jgi:predicted nucleic acid-binding protein